MIINGDALEVLKRLEDGSVQMIATSPPYYGLRKNNLKPKIWGGDPNCEHDWTVTHPPGFRSSDTRPGPMQHEGNMNRHTLTSDICSKCGAWKGELGLEPTPQMYVQHIVEIGREISRVLRDDGVFWLNLGDSYSAQSTHSAKVERGGYNPLARDVRNELKFEPFAKQKDLMMIPAMAAIALRDDGWYLRQQHPWLKRNCLSGGTWIYAKTQKGEMPSTVKDLSRLDPKTIQLWDGEKWNQVIDIFKQDINTRDNLIEIELRSGERLNCTEDHRWPTTRGIIEAKFLNVGDVLKTTTLPDSQRGAPELLPDEDIGWICGLYLSEGHYDGRTIIFSGHINETDTRYTRLKKIASRYDGTAWIHRELGNGQKVAISGKSLVATIHQYISGDTCKTKHLARKAWNRNNVFLSSLLDGYLEGDGHFDKENNRWRLGFTNNEQLAVDIRGICARLGYSLTLKRATATAETGGKRYLCWRGEIRKVRNQPSETPGTFKHSPRSEVVSIQRSRMQTTWDISIRDEPHVFALASGVLTHNSMPDSTDDRPACAVEYIYLFSKSGDITFWTHRDGLPGVRKRPEPDYRWFDRINGVELDKEPENWKEEVVPGEFNKSGDPVRRYKRYNLWRGHDYYFDMDAILVPHKTKEPKNKKNERGYTTKEGDGHADAGKMPQRHGGAINYGDGGRHRRNSDWFWESWQGLYVEDGETLAFTVNPKGYKGAHFSVWPPLLVLPMILSSTSEAGCCPSCGAPYYRVVEKTSVFPPADPIERKGVLLTKEESAKVLWCEAGGGEYRITIPGEKHDSLWTEQTTNGGGRAAHMNKQGYTIFFFNMRPTSIEAWKSACGADSNGEYNGESEKWKKQDELGKNTYTGFNARYKAAQLQNASDVKRRVLEGMKEVKTVKWAPTCRCNAGAPIPCMVLDPHGGSCTTGQVAFETGRRWMCIEPNPDYCELGYKRIAESREKIKKEEKHDTNG